MYDTCDRCGTETNVGSVLCEDCKWVERTTAILDEVIPVDPAPTRNPEGPKR